MSDNPPAQFALHEMETIRRHYLLNTFLCEQKTMFTLFRSKKVVTFAHNRDLKMNDTIPIRRSIPTGKDDFIVRVIQINKVFDYIILEADEPMFVSEPALHLPQVGHCNIVYGGGDEWSIQRVDLLEYVQSKEGSVFWKGVSSQRPSSSPEGGGCYSTDSPDLWGICVGYRQLLSKADGSDSDLYEFSFSFAGMFF